MINKKLRDYMWAPVERQGISAMSEATEQKQAQEMLSSGRGHYIVGQALFLAINEIESRSSHEQEPSNVADMRFLLDNLFPRTYENWSFGRKGISELRKEVESYKKEDL